MTAPDGTRSVVSTEEVLSFGGAQLALDFAVNQGDEVSAGSVALQGGGFLAGTPIEVIVFSDPIQIGTLIADANGGFDANLQLPDSVKPGEHRVLVRGAGQTGPATGTWFFSVGETGLIERIGDPGRAPAAGSADEPVGGQEEASGEEEDQLETPAAAAGEEIDEEPLIDDETGLPVYDPAQDPERSVETGVNGFALLAVLSTAAC